MEFWDNRFVSVVRFVEIVLVKFVIQEECRIVHICLIYLQQFCSLNDMDCVLFFTNVFFF